MKLKVTKKKVHDFKQHPMTIALFEYLGERIDEYEILGKSVVNQLVVIDDKIKAELNAMAGRLHVLRAITEGAVFEAMVSESEEDKAEEEKSE